MIKLPTKLWLRRTISNSIMGYFFLSYSRKTKSSKASGFNNVAVSLWLSTKYTDLRVALSWTCLKNHFLKDDFCCPTTNHKVALQQSYKQFSVSWAVKVWRGQQDWRYEIRVSLFWIILCMAPKTAALQYCVSWQGWNGRSVGAGTLQGTSGWQGEKYRISCSRSTNFTGYAAESRQSVSKYGGLWIQMKGIKKLLWIQ